LENISPKTLGNIKREKKGKEKSLPPPHTTGKRPSSSFKSNNKNKKN
jgi:hypothetical protein